MRDAEKVLEQVLAIDLGGLNSIPIVETFKNHLITTEPLIFSERWATSWKAIKSQGNKHSWRNESKDVKLHVNLSKLQNENYYYTSESSHDEKDRLTRKRQVCRHRVRRLKIVIK